MKGIKAALVVTCSTLATMFTLLVIIAVMWSNSAYLPWTQVPEGVYNQDDLISYCRNEVTKPFSLEFPGETITLNTDTLMDVSVKVSEQSYWDFLKGERPQVSCTWSYDRNKIILALRKLYKKAEDARIQMTDNGTFQLIKEVSGRDFDVEELSQVLIDSMKHQEFRLDMESYLTEPNTYSTSLKPTFDSIKWVNDWSVLYDCDIRVDANNLKNCWDNNYIFNPDNADFDTTIASLQEKYNTTNGVLKFKNTDGVDMDMPYNTFGVSVSIDKEKEFLSEALLNRECVVGRTPYTYGYDNFTNTYIEISLEKQHLWHYVNGEVCCETDCVTGTKGRHDTPTGVFYVSEKINGKYLKGEGYKTWVNKWMRLTNQGVGLHDAGWRGRFGKSIYTYSGSHGCINLPSAYAYDLYDEISTGIPVVIY